MGGVPPSLPDSPSAEPLALVARDSKLRSCFPKVVLDLGQSMIRSQCLHRVMLERPWVRASGFERMGREWAAIDRYNWNDPTVRGPGTRLDVKLGGLRAPGPHRGTIRYVRRPVRCTRVMAQRAGEVPGSGGGRRGRKNTAAGPDRHGARSDGGRGTPGWGSFGAGTVAGGA